MSQTIEDLRATLFATLAGVKDGTVALDTARSINEISKTIIDTAKVEVDYIRALEGEGHSAFIQPDKGGTRSALPGEAMNGIKSITWHVLEG